MNDDDLTPVNFVEVDRLVAEKMDANAKAAITQSELQQEEPQVQKEAQLQEEAQLQKEAELQEKAHPEVQLQPFKSDALSWEAPSHKDLVKWRWMRRERYMNPHRYTKHGILSGPGLKCITCHQAKSFQHRCIDCFGLVCSGALRNDNLICSKSMFEFRCEAYKRVDAVVDLTEEKEGDDKYICWFCMVAKEHHDGTCSTDCKVCAEALEKAKCRRDFSTLGPASGFGLFAVGDKEPGTTIGQFLGPLIKQQDYNDAFQHPDQKENNLLKDAIEVEEDMVLIADEPIGVSRFMNCCRSPDIDNGKTNNCAITVIGTEAFAMTTEKVWDGQELFCYYGGEYWTRESENIDINRDKRDKAKIKAQPKNILEVNITMAKMDELITIVLPMKGYMQDPAASDYDPNWSAKKQFSAGLKKSELLPDHSAEFGFSMMRLTESELSPVQQACHSLFKYGVETGKTSSWGHNLYMSNSLRKVAWRLNTWTASTQVDRETLAGKNGDEADAAARAIVITPETYPTMKSMLEGLGCKFLSRLKKWLVATCGNAVPLLADFTSTVNVGSVPIIAHGDDGRADGPGYFVIVVCVQGEGMLSFQPLTNTKKEKYHHKWLTPGCIYMFWGRLRLQWTHAVFTFPFSAPEIDVSNSKTRISLTFRVAALRDRDLAKYDRAHGLMQQAQSKIEVDQVLVDQSLKKEPLEELKSRGWKTTGQILMRIISTQASSANGPPTFCVYQSLAAAKATNAGLHAPIESGNFFMGATYTNDKVYVHILAVGYLQTGSNGKWRANVVCVYQTMGAWSDPVFITGSKFVNSELVRVEGAVQACTAYNTAEKVKVYLSSVAFLAETKFHESYEASRLR